jgi:hypothetical protein
MEDTERYLNALRHSDALTRKLLNTLEEDKQNICRGMSGEAEALYLKQTDQVIDGIKKIQRKIRLLYSESSAG